MIYEFDSHEAMIEAWRAQPDLCGPSPGGAASMLHITRQGVYSAVKRGSLDMIRLKEPGRPGPRPGFRQRVKLEADKHFSQVWPSDR